MRGSRVPLSIVACCLAAVSVSGAVQVVEFTDGRYLRVESHQSSDGWIRLDLPDGWLLVPEDHVQSIAREADRHVVYAKRVKPQRSTADRLRVGPVTDGARPAHERPASTAEVITAEWTTLGARPVDLGAD
jgi:hypothetical protein